MVLQLNLHPVREQDSSAYSYPASSYILRSATDDALDGALWSTSSLSLSHPMNVLTLSSSVSSSIVLGPVSSSPVAISPSGMSLMPLAPLASAREVSKTSTPMYARIASVEGSASPLSMRSLPWPAALLSLMTASTILRGSLRSSKALGTTTASTSSPNSRVSGSGSLTTATPSMTGTSDSTPE